MFVHFRDWGVPLAVHTGWTPFAMSLVLFTVSSMSRHNPKKDKSARRRRPDPRPGGTLRSARMNFEDVVAGMLKAPPELLPLYGLASVWLWNLEQDGAQASHCIDGCQTIRYALGHFGLEAHVEAVTLAISGNGSRTMYGSAGPR
ncbi:hypothetical protein [Microbispora sp. CA-102843]|uniref:hypothetical protein n=1 Tax=Microbispora sp. CA-102843 TaxID=3239952 RepID=UPI003D8A5D75